MKPNSKSQWRGPLLLLALGSLNILSGAFQLGNIAQGPPEVPGEFTAMHYYTSPLPIVLHIIAGTIWNLFGAFQFAPVIRRRWPKWHRWAGRFLIIAGFTIALTGLYMNHFFPAYGGWLKYAAIATHCIGMMLAITLALRAIFRRDIARHRVWMMRAFAIGLSPATQRLFILPIYMITGEMTDLMIALSTWGGLIVNLLVVEWILRPKRSKKAKALQVSAVRSH